MKTTGSKSIGLGFLDPIDTAYVEKYEGNIMSKVNSKRIERKLTIDRTRAPICKILRFSSEKTRLAQQILSSGNRTNRGFLDLAPKSSPTWQQMIILVLTKGPLCACEIAYAIGLSIHATSYQLNHLHEQKIVSYKDDGNMVFYSLEARAY